MGESEGARVEKLPLEYIDKTGKRHNAVLRATIVDLGKKLPVAKQEETAPASAAEEDNPWQRLAEGIALIIEPPYDLDFLALAGDNSSELGQNVRAMVTNTTNFGWSIREHPDLDDDKRGKHEDAIKQERARIRALLSSVHPKYSLRSLRAQVKHDKWQMGNGYLELIYGRTGNLVGLNHVHGHSIRLTALDQEPTVTKVPRVRSDKNFEVEWVSMEVRYRRFVQMRGDKLVWFKEAGDPRVLNRVTGEFLKEGEDELPPNQQATSLIHHRIYSPHTPYGVPVWAGNMFSFFGSRAAEEINFNTMSNNAVPSMFLIVENGQLTEDSIDRVKEFVESQVQASQNYSKVIILEGEPLEDGSPNPSAFKIKVEPVKRLQQTDELFQNYDGNNRDKLRQSFRLPPIFVGRSDDYTRATADTSRDIADEQVFAPDRMDDDELFHRFVLMAKGYESRYHTIKSLNPNVTDDSEIIKLMGIAEKSGGVTPRRADRIMRDVFGQDIGPMPKGVDLDIPFSILFANAQKKGESDQFLERLMDLRQKIDDELTDRYLDGDDE